MLRANLATRKAGRRTSPAAVGPDAVHRNPAPVSDAAQPQGASPYVPLPGERYGLSLRYFRWGITRLLTQVDVRSLPSVTVCKPISILLHFSP